ncbi:paraquat-inducible protein A [Palleronia caenipelagi]|uniref:Paraquat-inducible membrane protein A n=1 Tax=Palleronia caenipelagi TaxID=2489174 RepID=A0A547Q2P7_9RHOB|nr:paraquat-inducible protein A [Palleronia caenipelagi]TRD20666.1 paraquat-inducible membrane protein A [Palleronia caenipelagi]
MESSGTQKLITAREAGLVSCTRCSKVWPMEHKTCGRCGGKLVSRDMMSLQRVWAWMAVGLMCYIPANVFPMLNTQVLGKTSGNTIIGGAITLAHHGGYFVALVILLASVAIPVGKFIAVAYLAVSVRRPDMLRNEQRHKLYHFVEFIGRWSMIDVFVVIITSALIQFSVAVTVRPGIAAITFALSVIFTMFAAMSFDPRMIWDNDGRGWPETGNDRNE